MNFVSRTKIRNFHMKSNKFSQWNSKNVRTQFLKYFIDEQEHQFIKSSPTLSYFDSSVPFVNAGMCQFKRIFVGEENISHDKIANSQKCIRVGGKHNDLNVIGVDSYHHTFFEMLGNWSLGSYTKKDACRMAWELLTDRYQIPPSRLFVTYFSGDKASNLPEDEEVKNIWLDLGVDPSHLLHFESAYNFWEMGIVGPCGTCTEIHVALNPDFAHSAHLVNQNNPLLTELWNIVFIKYNRNADGSLTQLPREFIDTGMGLERLVALLDNKTSNYDTDLFMPMFRKIKEVCGVPSYQGTFGIDNLDSNYRCLADFSRMVTVAISDNIFPDTNPKLRRVLRKAIIIAEQKFKAKSPDSLICQLAGCVSESLSDIFPEIKCNLWQVELVVEQEFKTLKLLERRSNESWMQTLSKNPNLKKISLIEYPGLLDAYKYLVELLPSISSSFIPSEVVYNLYRTYGLERAVIQELGQTFGKTVVWNDVDHIAEQTKRRSKEYGSNDDRLNPFRSIGPPTDDSYKYNYRWLHTENRYEFADVQSKILAVVDENDDVLSSVSERREVTVTEDKKVGVILEKTNFFAEAGGQCSDKGELLVLSDGRYVRLWVHGVRRFQNLVIHYVTKHIDEISKALNVAINPNDLIVCRIDKAHRLKLMRNHTTMHLLGAILKRSFPISYLRDDQITDKHACGVFSIYGRKFNLTDRDSLECAIRNCISRKLCIKYEILNSSFELMNTPNVNLRSDEIYPSTGIRMITIYDEKGSVLSREPCCGTHLLNTAHIEEFCFLKLKPQVPITLYTLFATGNDAKTILHNRDRIHRNIESIIQKASRLNSSVVNIEQCAEICNRIIAVRNEARNIDSPNDQLFKEDMEKQLVKLRTTEKYVVECIENLTKHDLKCKFETTFSGNEKYIVEFCHVNAHVTQPTVLIESFPFRHVPFALFTHIYGKLHGMCYVPEGLETDRFNSFRWMAHIVKNMKGSKMKARETENYCNVHFFKQKISNAEKDRKISQLLTHARKFVEE